jgi:hypothetical protein
MTFQLIDVLFAFHLDNKSNTSSYFIAASSHDSSVSFATATAPAMRISWTAKAKTRQAQL